MNGKGHESSKVACSKKGCVILSLNDPIFHFSELMLANQGALHTWNSKKELTAIKSQKAINSTEYLHTTFKKLVLMQKLIWCTYVKLSHR